MIVDWRKLCPVLADLQAAVAALTEAVTNEITVVNAVIAALKSGGLSDADAEALAVQLQGSVTNLNNEVSSIQPPPALRSERILFEGEDDAT